MQNSTRGSEIVETLKNISGKLVTDEFDSAAGLNEFLTSLFIGGKWGEKI